MIATLFVLAILFVTSLALYYFIKDDIKQYESFEIYKNKSQDLKSYNKIVKCVRCKRPYNENDKWGGYKHLCDNCEDFSMLN